MCGIDKILCSGLNLNSSVDRYKRNQPYEITSNIFNMIDTIWVSHAMMFIARYCFIFAVLQFVAITRYYSSLRLAKKKQYRTLNTIQLRILGYKT